MLTPREGYSQTDAFKIFDWLCSQYINDVDTVLYRLVDLCDEGEIDFVTEGYRLFQILVQCPKRPKLVPMQSGEPHYRLDMLWPWSKHIERIYHQLRSTIGRSVRCQKEHPGEPRSEWDRESASRLISAGDCGSPTNSWVLLRIMLEIDDSTFGRVDEAEREEAELEESNQESQKGQRKPAQELADVIAGIGDLGLAPTDRTELANVMQKLCLEKD